MAVRLRDGVVILDSWAVTVPAKARIEVKGGLHDAR